MNFIKKTSLFFALLALFPFAQAHSGIVGDYDATVRQGITTSAKVNVSQDPQSSNKIWIGGILTEGKIYATQTAKDETSIVYAIPAQVVGGKNISSGSVIYSIDVDGNPDEIVITNDPSANPNQVTITNQGVNIQDAQGKSIVKTDASGNVAINSNDGTVQVQKNGNVAIKSAPPAQTGFFTFIGTKTGAKIKTSSN